MSKESALLVSTAEEVLNSSIKRLAIELSRKQRNQALSMIYDLLCRFDGNGTPSAYIIDNIIKVVSKKQDIAAH